MHKTAESYTATTPMDTRDWLRMAFANGDVEYLVAIRCLDEGIDIPETTRAYFMASSTNPRQFIQRRGRVLRRSDATGKAHADIHDFLSLLNPKVQTNGAYAESVILRELARIRGFAQLAENGPQVLTQLLDLPITPHLLIA
jgi:superfamily II DNA or RNA helicase